MSENHNFRIFIDAATLKPPYQAFAVDDDDVEFPHLYRCGHIEANKPVWLLASISMNFRIFIDAATLKQILDPHAHLPFRSFPHLYRCGHIEAVICACCENC